MLVAIDSRFLIFSHADQCVVLFRQDSGSVLRSERFWRSANFQSESRLGLVLFVQSLEEKMKLEALSLAEGFIPAQRDFIPRLGAKFNFVPVGSRLFYFEPC